MKFQLGLLDFLLLAAIQSLVFLLLSARLKASLQRENAVFLEKLRWEIKVREQAAKVAEYMALARALKESSLEEDYRMANRLAWELGMWLPTEVYRAMGQALSKPDGTINPLLVVIDVRKVLLGDAAGDLNQNDIIHHAPAIGKNPASRRLHPTLPQQTESLK